MTYCQGCGHQIHETAPTCPQCGAVQALAKRVELPATQTAGTLWLPVPALVCGVVAALSLLSPDDWGRDEILGVGMFSIAALVLGGLGVTRQQRGRGMSIAALVLGGIGLLGAIGMAVPA